PEGVVGDPALAGAVAAWLGEDATVDPAAARRRAVVPQLREAAHQAGPAGARVDLIQLVAVNLLEDLFQVWLALDPAEGAVGQARPFVKVVVPAEIEQRPVPGVGRTGVQLLEALAEVVEEPGVGAAVTQGIDGLAVPLEHPLRVGETALLLRRGRRGEEEDLGLDLGGGRAVRVALPEDRALGLKPVGNHPPSQVAHAPPPDAPLRPPPPPPPPPHP